MRRKKFGPRQAQKQDNKDNVNRQWRGPKLIEIGIMLLKAMNIYYYQKLEEGRKDPPLEVLKGTWSYQHLEIGILDAKLQRMCISLTKHSVYSALLWRSLEKAMAPHSSTLA